MKIFFLQSNLQQYSEKVSKIDIEKYAALKFKILNYIGHKKVLEVPRRKDWGYVLGFLIQPHNS